MLRLRTVVTLLILALVTVAVTVGAQTTPVETKPLDVPYVPTKEAIVDLLGMLAYGELVAAVMAAS